MYTLFLSLCVCISLLSIQPIFWCDTHALSYIYSCVVHCFFQVYLVDKILVFNLFVYMCKTHSHAEIGFSVHVLGFVAPFTHPIFVYLSSGSRQQSSYEFNLNPLMLHFHWMLNNFVVASGVVSAYNFFLLQYMH